MQMLCYRFFVDNVDANFQSVEDDKSCRASWEIQPFIGILLYLFIYIGNFYNLSLIYFALKNALIRPNDFTHNFNARND